VPQAVCSLGITDLCPHWPSGSVGAYCMPLFSSTLTGASLWLSILVLWVVPCSVVLVGSSLCFFGGCLLLLGCVPLLARVSSVASLFLPPLHWGSRLCCLWCVWLSPPLPPRLFPGGVLAQSSFCWIGPSLWVSGCFLRRPGCLTCCLECCGALLPGFMLLHGSKGLWPCVG